MLHYISYICKGILHRTGQRFGVSHIIDVLQGKTVERVIALGHDKLSTFGIGEEFSKPEGSINIL